MFAYPISSISKEEWNKKVAATAMFTIPAEDEALPILSQINDILENLLERPLEEVLAADVQQYFFQEVFAQVCSKIIKSRYFKNEIVLEISNKILGKCIQLYAKYVDLVPKFPGLNDALVTVFSSDEYYFKSNSQLDYRVDPFAYFERQDDPPLEFVKTVKEGDLIDVIKESTKSDKMVWSQGRVVLLCEDYLEIKYLHDAKNRAIKVATNSRHIAPYKSKSADFEWRLSLDVGMVVDIQDSFGSWYQGTVIEVKNNSNKTQEDKWQEVEFDAAGEEIVKKPQIDKAQDQSKEQQDDFVKHVLVDLVVYDQKGNKTDENGKYFGTKNQEQWVDVTNPKIMPEFSACKYRNYEMVKSSFEVDDSNDMVITEIDGQKTYALPRRRSLSSVYLTEINHFGRRGGFELPIKKLESEVNFPILCSYVKAVSGVNQYLHKQVVVELVERLKKIIQAHIFSNGDLVGKQFTKQRSEMLFSGFKSLLKRVYSSDECYKYENSLKMKLVSQCLDSQALKRKLQGLHELKDIVRSMSHTNERTKLIVIFCLNQKNWVIDEKIFEKIYFVNSHVQLIKKSEEFFKFLIAEDILQVADLERLYKIAQKGDYESRISLYKLFQQMSYTFRKPHVEFLIDTILQSDRSVTLNEDIDMLHELSRYSNYFPKEKVKNFFEGLILSDTTNKSLTDYAIKKYADTVSKGSEMKIYRREVIKNFIMKIGSSDSEKIIRLLKCIFEGLNFGEWGKKDLVDILNEQQIEELIVCSIKSDNSSESRKHTTEMLDFFLFLVKLNSRILIQLQSLEQIWQQLKSDDSQRKEYISWLNEVMKCEQGVETPDFMNIAKFYRELFPEENIKNMTEVEFQLAKALFVEINRNLRFISVSTVIADKEVERQYNRLTDFHNLKLIDNIKRIMFEATDDSVYNAAFGLYLQLYSSKENTAEEIQPFLEQCIEALHKHYETRNLEPIKRTLKVIEMLINDSEKLRELEIPSMVKNRKGQLISLTILNDTSYLSDLPKKHTLYVRRNISLFQLKQKICEEINQPRAEIQVMGAFDLIDYYNSYTLAELGISQEYALTVSKKAPYEPPREELIIDGKLNPKAVRVFKIIFDKYAKIEGKLSKEDYNTFTAACLGTISKNYMSKIQPIYQQYDSDKDGYLTLEEFLTFYTNASLQKASVVWGNLIHLNVKPNFRFKHEPELTLKQQELPRYRLYQNEEIYDILFSLLEEKQISKYIFSFLLRLPANQNMSEQLKGVWLEDSGSKGRELLEKILTEQSKFRLYYKLIVILNILEYTSTANSTWNVKFAINRGYEIPFKFLKQLSAQGEFSAIELDIIELIFQIVKDYIFNSFGTKESIESSNLFEDSCSLDEKMEYLLTGVFPKSYSLSKRDFSFTYRYQWQESQSEMAHLLFRLLKNLKSHAKSEEQINCKVVCLSMAHKLMSMLTCLLNSASQQEIIDNYEFFFDGKPSDRNLTDFYTMVLCLCCYSEVRDQHLHIRELFKYIKSKGITSEHFRVLAFLVSKYGFKGENVEEIPEILLKNILEEENEPTIEGCAKLLRNFENSQLEGISAEEVNKIFDRCLFGSAITCPQEQPRNELYSLLYKLCEVNSALSETIVPKTKSIIEQNLSRMKVTSSSEVNKRHSSGFAGLRNLGNICYMNSMLQQLYMNPTFKKLLLRVNDQKPEELTVDYKGNPVDDNFLHQVQRIFAYLDKTTRQEFSPVAFCAAYKPFGGPIDIMVQQDVQEFVSMFFDRLEEGIKGTPLERLVENFYTGKSVNLFKCHKCHQTKHIEENFHSLTLEVKNSKDLSESFSRHILGEMISDFRCDFCHEKADVSKMSRISKPPQVLIIHLQRMVFNLDTFILEKITSRHEFPMEFNLYPYTLEYYNKQESKEKEAASTDLQNNCEYELTGIIVHIGNAESGHYISYIKTSSQQKAEGVETKAEKWHQFNDGLLSQFSSMNIESECFGGISSTFEDEFDWDKKENSKSAYLLIYTKKSEPNIELVMKDIMKKDKILEEYQLTEKAASRPTEAQVNQVADEKQSEPTESQEESSSMFEDSEKEKERERLKEEDYIREMEMIKHKKSEDHTESKFGDDFKSGPSNDPKSEKQQQSSCSSNLVKIDAQKLPYFISPELDKEIEGDNFVHFFETTLASEGFASFFANLINVPNSAEQEMVDLCQKMMFGFWLKSKSFKRLLDAFSKYLKRNLLKAPELVFGRENLITLLVEYSDGEVRSNVACFLADMTESYLKQHSKAVKQQDGHQRVEVDKEARLAVSEYLKRIFGLIPTSVTKCWTKFNQYFEFWYRLSEKELMFEHLVELELVKHLVDYFLDKKSPLKIYCTSKVQDIGSSYVNPDFTMLLRCVSELLGRYFRDQSGFSLSDEQSSVVVHFEFIEKLISEGQEELAAKMCMHICPNNPQASEKFAVVLLKGFSKSTYENVQKYIEVLSSYITIEDEFQLLRMEWVLGKQTLHVSTMTRNLIALNSYSSEERIFYFDSSLHVEQGASFLEPIFQLNKRVENFCILCVQGILRICEKHKSVRDYVFGLGPPNLLYARYIETYDEFINRYIEDSKKSYYSIVTHFNKTELGTEVLALYEKLMKEYSEEKEINEREREQQNLEAPEPQISSSDLKHLDCPDESKAKKAKEVPFTVEENQGFEDIEFLDNSFNKNKSTEKAKGHQEVEYIPKSGKEEEKTGEGTDDAWDTAQGYNLEAEGDDSFHYDPRDFEDKQPQQETGFLGAEGSSNKNNSKASAGDSERDEEFTDEEEQNKVIKELGIIFGDTDEINQELREGDRGFYQTEEKQGDAAAEEENIMKLLNNEEQANQSFEPPGIEPRSSSGQQSADEQKAKEPSVDKNSNNYEYSGYEGYQEEDADELLEHLNPKNPSSSQSQDQDAQRQQGSKDPYANFQQGDYEGYESHVNFGENQNQHTNAEVMDLSSDDQSGEYVIRQENGKRKIRGNRSPSRKANTQSSFKRTGRSNKKGLRVNIGADVGGVDADNESDKKAKRNSEGESSDEEGIQMEDMSTTHKASSPQKKSHQKPTYLFQRLAYHPIKFIYKPVSDIEVGADLYHTDVTYHESELIWLQTRPSRSGNLSFKGNFGSGKMINRIREECWKTQRQEIVKGYYVKNESRLYLRVMTDRGCSLIKPNDEAWIWSEKIIKMWKCERSHGEWPNWSLFSNGLLTLKK